MATGGVSSWQSSTRWPSIAVAATCWAVTMALAPAVTTIMFSALLATQTWAWPVGTPSSSMTSATCTP